MYGKDKLSMSLKDTCLHPQASLFISKPDNSLLFLRFYVSYMHENLERLG